MNQEPNKYPLKTAYEKSLFIRESILGDSHPNIDVTYYHIEMTLDEDGDINKAETCAMKAVEVYDQVPKYS